MSAPVAAGLVVTGMMTNFQSTVNSVSTVELIANVGQLAASVAAVATSPAAALSVVNVNGAAAMLTIAKIQLDAKDGKPFDPNDALSLAGNVLSIAVAVGVWITPTGTAAKLLIKAAQIIGGAQGSVRISVCEAV